MIFPPAFLDSSSWNDNQHHHHQQQQQHAHGQQVAAGGGGGDGGNNHELIQPSIMGGALADGGGPMGPAKPMSMAERARLARIPLPEPGLKCPRCESTNTKFCYFNNYSLTQPRHFCRACRRYWTRGGALRNVPVGGGYRRHAKRAKPKASASAAAATSTGTAAIATAAASGAPNTAGSTASSTCTTANAPSLPAMLGGNLSMLPPLLRLADFDAMSLGSTFSGMGKPPSSLDAAGAYSVGGGHPGLEQWRVQQMQSFPFLHAMDQGALAPAPPMAMHGMFQLGLDTDSGRGGGGGGEDRSGELHGMPTKREGYPRGGMYGDHHLTAGGYTPYANNATGNHLL